MRSATKCLSATQTRVEVSIHALLAECDLCHTTRLPRNPRFQSTHSLRSATNQLLTSPPPASFQSTHSLRSATGAGILSLVLFVVSIHALLAECDRLLALSGAVYIMFQSTHSLRSATNPQGQGQRPRSVSIHALLAECDTGRASETVSANSFNPRTPCGVRRYPVPVLGTSEWFQSTHSLRSATVSTSPVG